MFPNESRLKLTFEPRLHVHSTFHSVASPPTGPCFMISHGKWLFYNVSPLSSARQHWISSHSTLLPNIFWNLFELKSVQFHWLLPNGYFSLVDKQWGINNTCLSLKYTFIKQACAALHGPAESYIAHTVTLLHIAEATEMQFSHWLRHCWIVCNGCIAREQ